MAAGLLQFQRLVDIRCIIERRLVVHQFGFEPHLAWVSGYVRKRCGLMRRNAKLCGISGTFSMDTCIGQPPLVVGRDVRLPDSSRKRPRDPSQLGKMIVDIATGEVEDTTPDDGKDAAAVELGRKGGLKGGRARAAKMTPEARSEAARKAAEARWGPRSAANAGSHPD